MSEQRRDSERIPVPGQIAGEVMVFEPMCILDISHGGAQVETSFQLQLDSLHDFRIGLGEKSVVVKGRIASCKIGELREGGVLYRSGIEFIEPSEHAREAIAEFVEQQRLARATRPIVDAEIAEDNV